MAHGTPTATTTNSGDVAWQWIGRDERGRELEVVETQGERDAAPVLLVIHVMPKYRRGDAS